MKGSLRRVSMVLVSVAIVMAGCFALPALATDKSTGRFFKGDRVFILLPFTTAQRMSDSHLDIIDDNGTPLVAGKSLEEWMTSDVPRLGVAVVKSIKHDKRHNAIRLKLRVDDDFRGKMLLSPPREDWKAKLTGVFVFSDRHAAQEAAERWIDTFATSYLDSHLQGVLENGDKEPWIKTWKYWFLITRSSDPGFGLYEADGGEYLTVDLGAGDTIYNSLQVSRRGMIARRLSPEIIKPIKTFYEILHKLHGIHGLHVTFSAAYRDFLREEYQAPHLIACELTVSTGDLKDLKELKITDQDLIEESFLVCDDTRMEINLGAIQ